MKVLVLGASGMLGHKLVQRLGERFEVTGTLRGDPAAAPLHPALRGARLVGGVRAEDPDSVVRVLGDVRPAVVVNALGIVKQKQESREAVPAIVVNALFPHRLAELCRAGGARLVHFSTDCVFSGRQGMYTEDDLPDPVDLYGRTKLVGEVSGPGCLTLRSSIIGRELVAGTSLLEWFRRQRGGTARGYTRAIYSGITTAVMADLVGWLLAEHAGLHGVWHVASEPIDKFALLAQVERTLGWSVRLERDESFVCDRSLDGSRFAARTGWRAPAWKDMIQGLADDPTPYEA
jgi:dTDP-4-dehydrorhamnose reductase